MAEDSIKKQHDEVNLQNGAAWSFILGESSAISPDKVKVNSQS